MGRYYSACDLSNGHACWRVAFDYLMTIPIAQTINILSGGLCFYFVSRMSALSVPSERLNQSAENKN